MEMFNFTSGQYEPINQQAASFNVDNVVTVDVSASIADYVQAGTGTVKARIGWRAESLVLLFPWTVCVDQVKWTIVQ